MSSAFRASSLPLALSLSLICSVFSPAQSSSTPPIGARSPDESDLRAVVEQYFAFQAGKDLDGLMSLWSRKSPDYASFKQSLQEQFATEEYRFSIPAISRVKVEGERASLRATVNLTAVNLKNNQKREQRIARNFSLVREDGKWKVWRSAPAENDLAEALAKSKTEAERAGLLADEKDLAPAELAQALNNQGARLYEQGDLPRALALHRLAHELAEQPGDRAGIARALNSIGNVHWAQGDYARALDYFQKSLALSKALGDQIGVANTLRNIGNIQYSQGDYAQALESFRGGLELSEKFGNKAGIARSLGSLGVVYDTQGDYAQALEYYSKCLKQFETIDDKSGIARTLGNIGIVHFELGDYTEALESHRQSLKLFEEKGDKAGSARTLHNIGNVYHSQGNYAQSLEYYQKSLIPREAMGDKPGIAKTLAGIGNIHFDQSNYTQALRYFQQSLAMSEAMGAKAGIAERLTSIGMVHHLQGDNARALGHFQQSLAMKESLGDKAGIAETLNWIGIVHRRQGAYAQALERFQKSLEMKEALGDKPGIAVALYNLGSVRYRQGDYAQALDFAERAATVARSIGESNTLWESLAMAGGAYQQLNKPVEARQALAEAITIVETLRAQVAGGESEQQRSFASKVAPYHAMVDLFTREGKLAEALTFAERAKARVLLDALQTGRVNVTKAMTAHEQEQERKMNGQLVALNTQITRETARRKPVQARLTELKAQLQKARLDFESFQTNLYAAHPDLRGQRGEAQPLRLEEAAALLPDAASALLDYVVTDDKTYLFVITKAAGKTDVEVSVYTARVKRDELNRQSEDFRRQLAGRDLGFRAPAAKLYELLLKPAEAQLRGKTNLIIVPDDKLWDLPFQALLTEGGRYLIETSAVSYAPSLTVLREMKRRRNQPKSTATPSALLALGNPTIGKETIERATLTLRDGKLDPLPEAEQEVKAIGRLYGAARSKVYVGAEAREDRAKAEAAQARILHFATHGMLNDASPMYSHLVLAQGDKNEDGLLEAWELMQLDLKADLAVLSACETARGRFGAGEGMIGLSWALFVAGVPSTVVSQWKVESAATRELMLGFHRQLRARNPAPKAEALRQAALTLMKNPETSHPFYWAGFVLVGDGR
ncbi:MAG: tetratricopeptide repeat protein [Blastocatellia bacterium]